MTLGDWTKIFDLKPRYLFAVWFIGAMLLLSPPIVSSRFGFSTVVSNYRGWIGLLTLSFFTLWLIQLFAHYREETKRRNLERQETRRKEQELVEAKEKIAQKKASILKSI